MHNLLHSLRPPALGVPHGFGQAGDGGSREDHDRDEGSPPHVPGAGLPGWHSGPSACCAFVATGALAEQPDQFRGITTRLDGPVKGDFDGMLERR